MAIHLYLSMVPEALIASMLPPREFGSYLAVGTRKRSRGQALFFDLAEDFDSDHFDLSSLPERCVPHPDGEPKHSVYVAIYRVMEHVPRSALNNLWLATQDGRVLALQPGEAPTPSPVSYHLYQEVCPVHPLIVSTLSPLDFSQFITDPSRPIFVPRICFVDLDLGELAEDPAGGQAHDLPYPGLQHLRDCLVELGQAPDKHTKTVDRIHPETFPYRCISSGFYVGDQDGILHYPFPPREELESTHYLWWRSATV